jgi:uncharacterized protein (TIGR02421 family)
MLQLTTDEICARLRAGGPLEAVASDTGCAIRVRSWVPHIATAIHAGSRMPHELEIRSALNAFERWQEEDPDTDTFIADMPIVLVGLDSRYAYDLNRAPEAAVYDEAWGKKVWLRPPTRAERKRMLERHARFLRIAETLAAEAVRRFGAAIVYDIHSYNGHRWGRPVPTFNLGTERIDRGWDPEVDSFRAHLGRIALPEPLEASTAVNDVFAGRGHFLAHLTATVPGCCVLATEVCKVYCDERTGTRYPEVVAALRSGLGAAIAAHAAEFKARHTRPASGTAASRPSAEGIEPAALAVDRALHRLVRDFEVLRHVNPTNLDRERRAFFSSGASALPRFAYGKLDISPFAMKRALLRLPAERITDPSLARLYETTIGAYLDKVDLLASVGTPEFLYNSLRYYGAPSATDLRNATYLLHLPEVEGDADVERPIPDAEAVEAFREGLARYGIAGRAELSNRIVADAMVMNRERKVLVRKGAAFRPKELAYLIHHEVGVHLVTTVNAESQPLRLLSLGTRVSTRTQEGLAVLVEYLSGSTTLRRLRELGLRTLAVDAVVHGADFVETYRMLTKEYGLAAEAAFGLAARVHRGGGLTKDYLYLQGLREVFAMWRRGADLSPLLAGKCSMEYYAELSDLLARGVLEAPRLRPIPLDAPSTGLNGPIFDYIVSGIR